MIEHKVYTIKLDRIGLKISTKSLLWFIASTTCLIYFRNIKINRKYNGYSYEHNTRKGTNPSLAFPNLQHTRSGYWVKYRNRMPKVSRA